MSSSFKKPINEYPVDGLMPKQDTQAAAFMKKFPSYDGRVDPGAAGMQVTSDGKPKVIDLVDCTGGGDVITTTVVRPSEDTVNGEKVQVIQGLSGRKLIIKPDWKNPSGEYRIGLKRAYELFPSGLTSRLKDDRRHAFEVKHAHLLSTAQARLAEFTKKNSKTTDKNLIKEKLDLEAQIELLKEQMQSYDDPGVMLDCVLFFDGKDWRAVIDVNESGDLRGNPTMTDYRKELQYHTFGEEDLLNFSVNIYEDGNLLSIVTLSGSHGTHVAGIAAANFPEEPALNGVAPGAQIVSLRIGDARLDSMETGPGLTRAAAHLAINKVDLANMSFGEPNGLPTDGHFIKLLAEEAVRKCGCIFVTSAGNDGPCYSSIGAPAGMDASFVTVGAYVKHAQMQAEYALLESFEEQPYTWSSKGPCSDGYNGVDIYAPGSAITSVPMYGLSKLDLKNGTSMSSPNACGCIALMVSALKAEKRQFTPFRLKTAVVQTAKSVNDPQNVGFIQVEKAWEYLETYQDRSDLDVLFEVTVVKRGTQRGVYLRESEETSQVQYLAVKVNPTFMREKDPLNPIYNRAKFDYEARIALIASTSWISTPDYLYLHSGGNAFQIKVDPTALKEGEFHYGEVLGYDTKNPERGPLFKVPVSVIKPITPENGSLLYKGIDFNPGDIIRRFIQVPEGACYATLTLRAKAPVGTCAARFMLHVLQLIPKKSQKDRQKYSFMLGSGSYSDPHSEEQVITKRFAVRGGLNLEVALAQFWSALGKHSVDINIEFHGVQIAGNLADGQSTLHLQPQLTRLDVIAPIRREDNVDISASFNKVRRYLRPTESTLTPLAADRNSLPSTKLLYSLVLTYAFKVDASITVSPAFPQVMNQLYDHYLAGVFGIVYDANCQVVGYLDVYSHDIKLKKKGDYKIVLQLMTEEESVLEKLKTTICELDMDVKSVNFNAFNTISDVYHADKSTLSKVVLERKDAKAFFIAPPSGDSALPKEAKPGDALVGTLTFTSSKVDGGQYKLLYTVPPNPMDSKKDNDKTDKKPTDVELQKNLANAMRDLQITYLKKAANDSSAYKAIASQLESQHGNDIQFLEYKIDAIWTSAGGAAECLVTPNKLGESQAKEIAGLADKILGQIDRRELSEFYGRKQPENPSEEQKEKTKENDKKKQQVIAALKNKTMAQAVTLVNDGQELESSLEELQQWVGEDASDLCIALVKVKLDRLTHRSGLALKTVQKYISEAGIGSDNSNELKKAWKMRAELYQELGWSIWSDYDSKWNLIRCPPGGFAAL
ncbi:subtilase family-domain-containing protein [Radiomyces spectabilis]|uniref:subtilase family-domain-containing protein n=1 Tax=Radiomyces spectabilis TaxID=64574 RepID=UPI00221E9389|nr:subtilase family-domain-containing protein [Radiomyces spectabilis]KAI8365920.1 subtilase family-domain-containing protein [Radiomyces spectabilis]